MNYVKLTFAERAAAVRFCETCEDNEAYDVSKPMMKRLAELGLVTHKGFGRYEQTDLLLEMQDDLREFCAVVESFRGLSVAVKACETEGSLDNTQHSAMKLLARQRDSLKLIERFDVLV